MYLASLQNYVKLLKAHRQLLSLRIITHSNKLAVHTSTHPLRECLQLAISEVDDIDTQKAMEVFNCALFHLLKQDGVTSA